MARKSALELEVERLNEKYCKHTKTELVCDYACGGVMVGLRKKNKKGGIASITEGHLTPQKTLNQLYARDSKGWIKYDVDYWEDYLNK